jgi:hypothetical protein
MSNATCEVWGALMRNNKHERLTPEDRHLLDLVARAIGPDGELAQAEFNELLATWSEEKKIEKAGLFKQWALRLETMNFMDLTRRHPNANN